MSEAAAGDMSSIQKAAVLLMSLGESDAAQILKHMGPKEVQRIGQAMAQLANVQRHQVEKVLDEFLILVGDQTGLGLGADGYIRNMLKEALGEEKAGSLIDRILLGGNTTGLDTLKWMEPRAIADIIRLEHPQIISIVLSYLEPDQAAEILSALVTFPTTNFILRKSSIVHCSSFSSFNNDRSFSIFSSDIFSAIFSTFCNFISIGFPIISNVGLSIPKYPSIFFEIFGIIG